MIASVLQGHEINVAILLKRLFKRYGVKTSVHNQHWLTLTRFSPFSAQWTN